MADGLFEFDEKEHVYTYAGIQMPSVNQLLALAGVKPGGKPAYISADVWDRASKFGKTSHKMLEFYDEGFLIEDGLDHNLLPVLNAWKEVRGAFGITAFTEVELATYSLKRWYAGTIDRVWRENVIDIKTGMVNDSDWFQLGGYSHAYRERTGKSINKCIRIKIDKNGKWRADEGFAKWCENLWLNTLNQLKQKGKL